MSTFDLRIVGGKKLVAKFGKMGGVLSEALGRRLRTLVIAMQSYVQTRKLQGQVLHHRSGVLSRSIDWRVDVDPGRVFAKLFVGKQAWYGKIHEYGGRFQVPSHESVRTKVFGKTVEPFSVFVREHFVVFPERSFMRSSLKEWTSRAVEQVRRAVGEAAAAS